MAFKLDQLEEQLLQGASRTAITDALTRLPILKRKDRWLPEKHIYVKPYLSSVLGDGNTIDGPALAERMAASIPNHVFDGWSYLGRAIHCLMRGDSRTAVHLGYYAELRSALALLASEGIGLFDRDHFVIQDTCAAERLIDNAGKPMRNGTHQMIWPVYSWWIRQSRSGDLLGDVIRPGHRPLRDWFTPSVHTDLSLQKNADEWLKVLGFDLHLMNQDRGARNAASYGPSGIHRWEVMEEAKAVKIILLMWQMFEPQYTSRFENVDLWFLREVLLTVFKGQSNRRWRSKKWDADFARFIGDFLGTQPQDRTTSREHEYWQEFLNDTISHEKPHPFSLAREKSRLSSESFPLELLSRAAFHLRFATGSCALMFNEANVDWDSLAFWLDDVGVRRRIWKKNERPEDPLELWADLEDAMDTIRDDTYQDHPSTPGIHTLEECERICFWGIAGAI